MFKKRLLVFVLVVLFVAPTQMQGGGTLAKGQAAACAVKKTLANGSHGGEVLCLQRFLISQGLLPASSATGFFGVLTEQAIRSFQTQSNLAPVGYVDKFTMAATAAVSQNGDVTQGAIHSIRASNVTPLSKPLLSGEKGGPTSSLNSTPLPGPYPELKHRPLVGLYYFGIWSTAFYDDRAEPLPVPATTVAKLPWWAGVEDFYMKAGPAYSLWAQRTPALADFSDRKPLIGYYDVRSVEVLERQIDQASRASVDFFNFYWYWNAKKHAPAFADEITSFRQANNKAKMRFAISLYAMTNPSMVIPAAEISSVIPAIIDVLADPAYLRVGGRPVVYLSDGRGIGDGSVAAVKDFIVGLRQEAARVGLPSLLVIAGAGIANGSAADIAQMPIDGMSCLQPRSTNIKAADDYDAFISGIPAYFATMLRNYQKPVAPCAAANVDERPLQIHNLVAGPDTYRYYANFTPHKFYLGMQKVREWQKTQNSAISGIVSIYAWNEWWEGGYIEPNVRDKDLMLNFVQRAFRTSTLNEYSGNTVAIGHRDTTQTLPMPWTRQAEWEIFVEQDNAGSRITLRECMSGSHYFVSKAIDCEGGASLGVVGYLAAHQNDIQDLVPLYSCSLPDGDRFVRTSADCDASIHPSANIRVGEVIGYGFPN